MSLLFFHQIINWSLNLKDQHNFEGSIQKTTGSVQPHEGCSAFNFWSKTQQTVKHFCGTVKVELRCLINEQTGRQPLFLHLCGFNEACLKNATCCSSY